MKKSIVKNNVIMLITILVLVLPSCSKFLDEKPYSFSTPDQLYTPGSIELALSGAYDVINANNLQGVGNQSLWGGRMPWIMMLGDEVVANFSKLTGDQLGIANCSYNTENRYISDAWFSLFVGVNRTNNLINKTPDLQIDEARKRQIVAEARFLRGFYTLYLTWMFGAVPLPDGIKDDAKTPREPLDKVYQRIEQDFKFAYANLDHRNSKAGRVNKWTAGGFLLKMYTYLAACKENNVGAELNFKLNSFDWVDAAKAYAEAETIGKDIYDNSQYKLDETYRNNFLDVTKEEQKNECLMVVQTGIGGNDDYYLFVGWINAEGADTYGGGRGYARPLGELKDKYNEKDTRFVHNITGNLSATSKTEVIKTATFYIPNAINNSGTTVCLSKLRQSSGDNRKSLGIPAFASLLNFPILRFADVMLLYAEAKYKRGDEAGARALIELIRKRATNNNAALLTELNTSYRKTNFMDELMDERARELCGESWRRIDLIRTGKMAETIANLKSPPSATYLATLGKYYYFNMLGAATVKENFALNKIWFPIPKVEVDVNPNLIPNPGY